MASRTQSEAIACGNATQFQFFNRSKLLGSLAMSFHEHIFGYIGYFFKTNVFNILTGQKRDVTELKLVWPVNMTGHYPKVICSPVDTCTGCGPMC